jgi:hypothetical protein
MLGTMSTSDFAARPDTKAEGCVDESGATAEDGAEIGCVDLVANGTRPLLTIRSPAPDAARHWACSPRATSLVHPLTNLESWTHRTLNPRIARPPLSSSADGAHQCP